jgi:hypothetical protein
MNETATLSPPPPAKRVVRFLTSNFDAYAERLGYTSNVKKARLVGCGIATMSRIRAGKQNPGPQVIAAFYRACGSEVAQGFFDFGGED